MSYILDPELRPCFPPVNTNDESGLTTQQYYPEEPLEPGYVWCPWLNPFLSTEWTGPQEPAQQAVSPLAPAPAPSSSPSHPPRRSRRPLSALDVLAKRPRIGDRLALGNLPRTRAKARVPVSSGRRLPAVDQSPVQSAGPVDPGLAAAVAARNAALTNEVMTSNVGGPRSMLATLQTFPRRRDISFRDGSVDFRGGVPRNEYWYAAASYIVGDIVPTPCEKCQGGTGKYSECVVAPRQPDGVPLFNGGCASCYHQGHANNCTLRPG